MCTSFRVDTHIFISLGRPPRSGIAGFDWLFCFGGKTFSMKVSSLSFNSGTTSQFWALLSLSHLLHTIVRLPHGCQPKCVSSSLLICSPLPALRPTQILPKPGVPLAPALGSCPPSPSQTRGPALRPPSCRSSLPTTHLDCSTNTLLHLLGAQNWGY